MKAQLLPKDLLVDLESGDRSAVWLEEVPGLLESFGPGEMVRMSNEMFLRQQLQGAQNSYVQQQQWGQTAVSGPMSGLFGGLGTFGRSVK